MCLWMLCGTYTSLGRGMLRRTYSKLGARPLTVLFLFSFIFCVLQFFFNECMKPSYTYKVLLWQQPSFQSHHSGPPLCVTAGKVLGPGTTQSPPPVPWSSLQVLLSSTVTHHVLEAGHCAQQSGGSPPHAGDDQLICTLPRRAGGIMNAVMCV